MHIKNEEDEMHAAESWQDTAEATSDVFKLPQIAPQGLDGVGHFNYYDNVRSLSFQWDGRLEQHVTVSHGGYGEAVKWTFDFMTHWRTGVMIDGQPHMSPQDPFLSAALHFKKACDNWITYMEDRF